MLRSNVSGDTAFSTRLRAMPRVGTLLGVFGIVLLSLGASQVGPCPGGNVPPPSTPTVCTADNAATVCDDGNSCTTDTCAIAAGATEGECNHANCPEGQVCDSGACKTPCTAANAAADCDDGNACTDDSCGDDHFCEASTATDCNDDDACTDDACNPATGCTHTDVTCDPGEVCDSTDGCGPIPCQQASECDDDDACTVNRCVAGVCDFTEPVCADDGDLCTDDVCTDGTCSHPAVVCPNAGETCDPATGDCIAGPTEFTVTATCPASLSQDGSGPVDATVVNTSPTGAVTFSWEVTSGAGNFTDAAAASTDFTLTSAAGGSLRITATDDNGTPGDATDDVVSTDTCNIALGAVLFQVNAGADRILVPVAGDFSTGVAFGAGGQLVSGSATAPGLAAVTNRGVNANVSFQWEVVSVPNGAVNTDVTIINTSAAATGYLVIPALANTSLALRVTGLTGNITNTVVPGNYVFRVTGIDLTTTPNQTDTDEVTYTFIPPFAIPAAAAPGSLQGVAVTNGGLTNRMVRPGTAATVAFQTLARLAGTLQYILTDTSGATDAQVAANQNAVTLTPTSPVAAVASDATVNATIRGSYTVNGSFAAGAGSIASTATGVTTHVQPALPSAVDVRAPATALSALNTFGLINSTSVAATPIVNIHGARQAGVGAGAWDGTAVAAGDINGDGLQEIVTATFTGGAIKISMYHGVTADPSVNTNSPRPNVINNDGTLTAAGGLLDSFTITVVGVASVSAIALGDLDGDSRLDLVVGDSSFNAGGVAGTEGRVFVYYNQGHTGFALDPYNTVASAGVLLAGGALAPNAQFTRDDDAAGLDSFGHAVAIGDVSGDNIGDLVVGAPNSVDNVSGFTSGAVFGFLGSGARYTGVTTVTDAGAGASFRLIPTGSLAGDMVGASVAVAQVDGSGAQDVIYGAPGFSTTTVVAAEAGRVLVNFGGAGLNGVITTVGRVYEGNAANLGFGRRIVTCSFRGGTTTDILVSAEANTAATHVIASAVGRVFDFPTTQGGILNDGNTTLAGLPQIGGGAVDSNLGATMACGDLNNDGFADLLLLGASPTAANQRILLVNGSTTPAATLTANTTFSNGAGAAFLTTPVAPGALTTTAATYNANGASMDADVNGDGISDLFWQGLIASVVEAAFIAGAP